MAKGKHQKRNEKKLKAEIADKNKKQEREAAKNKRPYSFKKT